MMMYASLSAGLAFGAAGTAAAHAIQYPVGALTHTAHGIGVAALLPYVMTYNAPACTTALAEIGQALGATGTTTDMATTAIEKVRVLLAEIGIPRTLAELGLAEDHLDWVAEQSLLSARLVTNNPRKLDLAGMRDIVTDAFHGRNRAIGA
jgi:alcohol dehydrogenase